MSQIRRELEQRARGAILEEAIFRWENAINLAFVIILAIVFPKFWWAFIILGLIVGTGIAIATLANPAINAKAVAVIFERKFQPQKLKTTDLRKKTEKSLEYMRQIEEVIAQTKEGVLRDRLQRTTNEVVDWVVAIHRLASRIDAYNEDRVIERDRVAVPKTIEQLRRRLAEEDDPTVKGQIEETIQDKQQQLSNLEQLQNTIESAGLQLERTLSALGTVYSQLLLLDTKSESSGRAERLQEEISEQVHQLQDLTVAMDEVYTEG
jgi:hypothetical protein